ncbi:transmembrane protein, putative (macronuclear) [Tetrahymena thermophila SB210]|uniref:Transmembrane protein, putative n=1 Tax=Tetrahymena thermophila (strain SB210) TaxID=312017 RepID=W7XAS8_TETTS|nr:transmembrane protein, putative [Tetrahymena thermophila SB210]EWS74457.1 transmembrane protein, putative [Tetrahymena thermophila SB210]|eukprot:XP_012653034.1 transmembrane protein, putative [Tetrahymena thermophila SB210]
MEAESILHSPLQNLSFLQKILIFKILLFIHSNINDYLYLKKIRIEDFYFYYFIYFYLYLFYKNLYFSYNKIHKIKSFLQFCLLGSQHQKNKSTLLNAQLKKIQNIKFQRLIIPKANQSINQFKKVKQIFF